MGGQIYRLDTCCCGRHINRSQRQLNTDISHCLIWNSLDRHRMNPNSRTAYRSYNWHRWGPSLILQLNNKPPNLLLALLQRLLLLLLLTSEPMQSCLPSSAPVAGGREFLSPGSKSRCLPYARNASPDSLFCPGNVAAAAFQCSHVLGNACLHWWSTLKTNEL